MPAFVNPHACDACKGQPEPLCQYICPNDLMLLDLGHGLAFNREPDMCSECFACVKICPPEAIAVRGYADFIPLGASAQPLVKPNEISWTLRFRDGRTKAFTFPTHIAPTPLSPVSPSLDRASLRGPLLRGEQGPLAVPKPRGAAK